MPDTAATLPTLEEADGLLPERKQLIAFTTDAEVEKALRVGLAEALRERLDIRRGGVRTAIAALRKMPTPRVLIVDVGGEDAPLTTLDELSTVTEPDASVLVIGDTRDVDFYRQVTRGLGAADYLPKPVTKEAVERVFAPIVRGEVLAAEAVAGGRAITVTGASGGTGASTVAVNLAWHFAAAHRRHTCLLDANLHCGSAALMLDVSPNPGLRTALQTPERVDKLFLERAAQPVQAGAAEGRLDVLASEQPMAADLDYQPQAAQPLLDALRRRYNLVVADTPFMPTPLVRDLFELVSQRVIVFEPTLASLRGAVRLLEIPPSVHQSRRPILVLNRLGRPGGLNRRQVEAALKGRVDLVIPDLPRQLASALNLGVPIASGRGPFRDAMAELAPLVAFVRLLDRRGGADDQRQVARKRSRLQALRERWRR